MPDVQDEFIETIIDTLGRQPLLDNLGPLQEPEVLGRGGGGFVVRGYVLVPEVHGPQRVRWLVVKGPLPWPGEQGALVVENRDLERECDKRWRIGDLPGLGALPTKVSWPAELVERALPLRIRVQIELPRPAITLLMFELRDEHVADVPPWDLAKFVQGPVGRAVDLIIWCEIARSLGGTLLGMHHGGWVHGDIKLANVVAQRMRRYLRSFELIDFGHTRSFDTRAPRARRVAGLGGTEQYWRPERLAASRRGDPWTQASAVDEDVYAYASLLARVLLGRRAAPVAGEGPEAQPRFCHPDRPWAEEIEALVAELRAGPNEPAEPVPRAIGRAFALVHELLASEHAGSFEPITDFLHEVEQIRIEAEDGDSPSTGSRSALALVPNLLGALGNLSATEEEKLWCERYVTSDRELALHESGWSPGEPPDVDAACELVRNGYVTAARALLQDLLQGPRGIEHDREDARALRIYVGQILLREGDYTAGRAILARYRARLSPGAPRAGLAWWIKMLGARLDFFVHDDVSLEGLDHPELDERQQVWLLAFEVQQALRRKSPVTAASRKRLERVNRARSVSMSEILFVDMLLARCLARAGDLVGALQCLHKAAAVASRRRFPVEYANVLSHAPKVLLDFGDRAPLEQARLDVDALLEKAEELALRGADLLHRLRIDVERDRAIQVAFRCAEARGGRAGVAAAACLHELADANATLSQRASSVRRGDLETLRTPPAGGAQPIFAHHSPTLEKVWGPGGLSVELVGEDGAPRVGAALDELLREHALDPPPSPVLVVGCGTGSEVLHLVAKHAGVRVHGVDVNAWNVGEASDRASEPVARRHCSFRRADLVQGDALGEEDAGGKGPWELVVMRETLAYVTLKRSFLHALRRRVRPLTRLLMTELVQCQPEGPTAWRSQLGRLGVPNLTTRYALCDDLRAASFAVDREALDDTHALRRFLVSRQRWFESRADAAAEALHAQPKEKRWVKDLFEKLIEAAGSGALGWLHLSATAVGEDPPLPAAGGEPRSFSSRPPAKRSAASS